MSIPKKRNIEINKRKGDIKNFLNESYINEALGEFKTQYSMAEEISDNVLEMLRFHANQKTFEFNGKYRWNKCVLKVFYSENSTIKFISTTAVYQGSSNSEIHIDIKLSRNDVLSLTQTELKHKLVSIIAHELNHGHVVVNTYNSTGDIPAYPKLYNKVVEIIQSDINPENIVYKFAYSIYITSYLEVPAFVSQTTPELEKYFKDGDLWTLETFKKKIQQTEPYVNYKEIIDVIVPEINKFGLNNLLVKLQNNGVILSYDELKTMVKRIEYEAKAALKNVVRNAMIFYYKNNGKIL